MTVTGTDLVLALAAVFCIGCIAGVLAIVVAVLLWFRNESAEFDQELTEARKNPWIS